MRILLLLTSVLLLLCLAHHSILPFTSYPSSASSPRPLPALPAARSHPPFLFPPHNSARDQLSTQHVTSALHAAVELERSR